MTHAEQRKALQDLQYHRRSMSEKDRYDFDMLLKRDKDDEDLDSLARQTLERLSGTYLQKKSRKDVEELWKNLISRQEKDGGQ